MDAGPIERADPLADQMAEVRRHIHANPELSRSEVETARLIAGTLRGWGVPVTEGIGGHGLVATIEGIRADRAVGLRADMDALPILEQTGVAHASRHERRMHACGHDGHVAMLLGAVRRLLDGPRLDGTVHAIFQPAEEGHGGAKAMIADGLFERFACDAVYGMHVMPGIASGRFATRIGPFFASAFSWTVRFRGVGGHGGASPHLGTDLAPAVGQFLLGANTIVSRSLPADEGAVLSVGHVAGGAIDAPAVLPADFTIRGTARCFRAEIAATIRERLTALAEGAASSFGCVADVEVRPPSSTLVNAVRETKVAIAAATDVAGASNVAPDHARLTIAEDFSDMLMVRPGAFMLIGNGRAATGETPGLHSPRFDFNDAIIPHGIAYWTRVVAHEFETSP